MMYYKIMAYTLLLNCPIIWTLLVKAIVGSAANGSCKLMTALRLSLRLVKSYMSEENKARKKVGMMAIVRVKSTLFHLAHCKFKKPSIANWPAYVPVIVDDWPAASIPTPQIIKAARPNLQPKNIPPLNKSASTGLLSFY